MTTTANEAPVAALPSRGLAAALDYATGSHARAMVVLVAFTLLAFLPGFFGIPPVDRDEARFAQATKQMLESGQYVDIRFQDEVRYKKPVGIYWLQAAAVKAGEALGVPSAKTTIWLYRLPSLFGAIGAVLLTYWSALAFVTRRSAALSALMMAGSIILGVGRCAAEGAARFDVYRPHDRQPVDCRQILALDASDAARVGHSVDAAPRAALVYRDRGEVGRQLLRAGTRP